MSTLKVGTIQDHTNSITAISIDSSGRPTFPVNPAWRVHNVGAQSRTDWTGSPYQPIVYSATTLDTASGWTSGASNYYTIPVAGNYAFFINQRCDDPSDGAWFQMYLMVDSGSGYDYRHRWIVDFNDGSIGYHTFSISDMGIFAAGDKLQVRFGTNGDTAVTLQGAADANATSENQYSSFAGYRVG
tara:strand:+ start:1189 stop:1746 length:558 start_codon:yes stop_codon:yes gene_type:complete